MVNIEYQNGEPVAQPNKREELSIVKSEIRDKLFNLRKKSATFANRGKLDDDDRLRALKVNKEIEYLKKIKKSLTIDNPKLINAYQNGFIDKAAEKVVSLTENNYRAKLMNKYKKLAIRPAPASSIKKNYKPIRFLGMVR